MSQRARRLLLECLLISLSAAASHAADAVTGADVRRAVRRGVDAIYAAQKPDGSWGEPQLPGGITSLAAFTLLTAGERADDPRVRGALEIIRKLPNQHTYVASLKILALGAADPRKYRREISAAVDWLVAAQQVGGLWNYTEVGTRFDHSNTQFALLGLYAAATNGFSVPFNAWQKAQTALLRTQNPDGGWSYQVEDRSYGSMTAAGVADLLILNRTFAPNRERGFRDGAASGCGKHKTARPLQRGLEWLERHFQAGANPRLGEHTFYWLYAAERVGILSGRRFFGAHDWYRAGAHVLVRTQRDGGLWNSSLSDTCFAVLFLAKGHRSLLIQKLQWAADESWSPDRHDVENLVEFIDTALGQPVAWQVVPFDAPLEEWLAAPLLYFQGHEFPVWNPAQQAKLREFVTQGGTILAEACCGRAEFRSGFERFAAETFADLPLKPLPATHAVYNVLHHVEPMGLRGIDLGCRTGVIYSPDDLSCLWEQGDVPELGERAFQLGANIAAYAIGRRPLRDRLDEVVLPAATTEPGAIRSPSSDALRLAQLAYIGDWRPFPAALARLTEVLRSELGLDVISPERQVRLDDPALRLAPILFIQGSLDFQLTPAERDALAAHIKRGGFLIADACCGGEQFEVGLRRLLGELFPGAALERLPDDHPIIRSPAGFDASRVKFSPDVRRTRPELSTPQLWGLRVDGRLAIVFSPFSLSCGLSGPAFEGCWGYDSESARRVAANIVLYALTH
jgi:hypothetical protein